MTGYLASLSGGLLIGLSAISYLILTGRISGISGILGRLAGGHSVLVNGAFVVGLIVGPLIYALVFGALPQVTLVASTPLLIVAGLFVGIGARMGSGCTSGHGVLGLARLSPRSMVAVATFLASGIATVTLLRIIG